MLLNEAQNIVSVWGKHLEYCHERFQGLFIASIPRSLLPISAEKIEAALNTVAKHYHDMGDYDASNMVKEAFGPLMLYADDDEALQAAAWKFGDSQVRDAIRSRLSDIQKAANGAAYRT